MQQPWKVTLVTVGVIVVVALVVWIIVLANQRPGPSSAEASAVQVVRPDSHVLDQGPEGGVTVVEFLDF